MMVKKCNQSWWFRSYHRIDGNSSVQYLHLTHVCNPNTYNNHVWFVAIPALHIFPTAMIIILLISSVWLLFIAQSVVLDYHYSLARLEYIHYLFLEPLECHLMVLFWLQKWTVLLLFIDDKRDRQTDRERERESKIFCWRNFKNSFQNVFDPLKMNQ